MRLEVTGRHVAVTPVLRRIVERKVVKLERLLADVVVSAQVVLTEVPRARRADITLHTRGEHFLHSGAEAASWDEAMGRAIERLLQQAMKLKGKWQERKRPGRVPTAERVETRSPGTPPPARRRTRVPTARLPTTLHTARLAPASMTVSAAVRAIEASPDRVVVFRDAETTGLSVLVRRAGGDLALLEIES